MDLERVEEEKVVPKVLCVSNIELIFGVRRGETAFGRGSCSFLGWTFRLPFVDFELVATRLYYIEGGLSCRMCLFLVVFCLGSGEGDDNQGRYI